MMIEVLIGSQCQRFSKCLGLNSGTLNLGPGYPGELENAAFAPWSHTEGT
jgi:hypothetical protein